MSRGTITRTRVGALLAVLAIVLAGAVAFGCSGETATTTTAATAAPGTTAAPDTTAAPAASYVTVEVEETYEALNAGEGAQIVDVREPDEWATTGVPPGAVLIPLGDLEQQAPAALAKDKPVYVICNSGNRSRTGSEILLSLGYTEVYNVAGGIQAWLKAGLPVDTYTP